MNLILFIMLSINLKKLCELKVLFLIIIFGLFLIVSLNFISAFGVSIPYSMQDSLKLYPGQSAEVLVGLQSMLSEGDLTIVPEILQGQDIVKITDSLKEYDVIANQPAGTVVHLKVSIPENDKIGKEYTVKLMFRDITNRQVGMVGVSTSIGASFNVSIIEKPEIIKEKISSTKIILIILIILIIMIIAVIAIVWFLIKRKKENKLLELIKS